jgi:hypothetical protein
MRRCRGPRLRRASPDGWVTGTLGVGDSTVDVSKWRGTVGHNWESEHADSWIWLHADFGTAPGGWLELVLARIRIGRARLPWTAMGALSLDRERNRWAASAADHGSMGGPGGSPRMSPRRAPGCSSPSRPATTTRSRCAMPIPPEAPVPSGTPRSPTSSWSCAAPAAVRPPVQQPRRLRVRHEPERRRGHPAASTRRLTGVPLPAHAVRGRRLRQREGALPAWPFTPALMPRRPSSPTARPVPQARPRAAALVAACRPGPSHLPRRRDSGPARLPTLRLRLPRAPRQRPGRASGSAPTPTQAP